MTQSIAPELGSFSTLTLFVGGNEGTAESVSRRDAKLHRFHKVVVAVCDLQAKVVVNVKKLKQEVKYIKMAPSHEASSAVYAQLNIDKLFKEHRGVMREMQKVMMVVLYYDLLPIIHDYIKDENVQAYFADKQITRGFAGALMQAISRIQLAFSEQKCSVLKGITDEWLSKKRDHIRQLVAHRTKLTKRVTLSGEAREARKVYIVAREKLKAMLIGTYAMMRDKVTAQGDRLFKEGDIEASLMKDDHISSFFLRSLEMQYNILNKGASEFPELCDAFKAYEAAHLNFVSVS